MTDLHTHILPAMDDGSRNVTTTNILLQNEIENGVDQVAFTPHFFCDLDAKDSLKEFLKLRDESFSMIDLSLFPNLKVKLGAEVHFCEELLSLEDNDLLSLCLEGTQYLFLELSMFERPDLEIVKKLVDHLQSVGITPVLVHVERYHYLKVSEIKDFVTCGCLIQCNCESVLRDKKETAYVKSLISKNLVHIFATDTHSVARRPVNMAKSFESLESLGIKIDTFIENANKIFNGEKI